ncbi:TIGR01906 family membrane protein [Streptococcus infantis]|mgnify:FL=1|uniref:TIGR01906 family membrane protein n=1 Tax=Streptococcus infantis TaxID=68892 RepID=UPI001F351F61|nr:TIGR01906 family membrane protein [Streptococcus infantis]UJD03626.1 TIGR01906 family membrane protein [Streptococcus infantis]
MKTKLTFGGSLFFLLSLAILLTIYLAWFLYPLEISWLHLTSRVPFQPQTIQHNFNVLMDYLTNPLNQALKMPDFPSSASGIHHFAVVKGLFHLTQGVAMVTLPIFYLFWKQVIQKGFLSLFRRGLLIMLSLPLILGFVGVFIGFEQFFTLFHQILFVGDDTWLFDPAKDPVILILPEDFFLHTFLLFFCLYELIFGFMYLKSRKTGN